MNKRDGFWNFNLGHAITITLILVSVIGLYFKIDARLSAVETLATTTAIRLERVDDNGTKRSQIGLSSETELTRANTNRIQALENIVSTLTPKIERIDTNIQWLMTQQHNPPITKR